jgi:hypothetical protein
MFLDDEGNLGTKTKTATPKYFPLKIRGPMARSVHELSRDMITGYGGTSAFVIGPGSYMARVGTKHVPRDCIRPSDALDNHKTALKSAAARIKLANGQIYSYKSCRIINISKLLVPQLICSLHPPQNSTHAKVFSAKHHSGFLHD